MITIEAITAIATVGLLIVAIIGLCKRDNK